MSRGGMKGKVDRRTMILNVHLTKVFCNPCYFFVTF